MIGDDGKHRLHVTAAIRGLGIRSEIEGVECHGLY